jgi:biopolymer transport protein ExbD
VSVSATGEVRLDGRSDDDASYGPVITVLDRINEGGADVVGVLTEAP